MAFIALLYALTKPLMAVLTDDVLGPTVNVTGEVVVPVRFSVTPGVTSPTVLDALLMAMPLTVKFAFDAALVCDRLCVPAGSSDNRLLSVASPATEIFMLLATPVVLEVSTRR